jgi:hypothetical protein
VRPSWCRGRWFTRFGAGGPELPRRVNTTQRARRAAPRNTTDRHERKGEPEAPRGPT